MATGSKGEIRLLRPWMEHAAAFPGSAITPGGPDKGADEGGAFRRLLDEFERRSGVKIELEQDYTTRRLAAVPSAVVGAAVSWDAAPAGCGTVLDVWTVRLRVDGIEMDDALALVVEGAGKLRTLPVEALTLVRPDEVVDAARSRGRGEGR